MIYPEKNKYEKDHPKNWDSDKCSICNMPLKIDPIGPGAPNNKMYYGDFYISYKHKFLRNIFSKEKLASAPQIRTLKEYYKTFQKFIKVCVSLQSVLVSHVNFDDSDDNDHELKDFSQNNCAGCDNLDELRNDIENKEIKNIVKNTSYKIPRFNLKLYAFVYNRLVEFPEPDFAYDTVTKNNFFRNVYHMIKVKMHLHHSHVTGEILGYVHDFRNRRVRKNKTDFVIFAHTFFGFDMFFRLKGLPATACNTKDINVGGTNLTNINFAKISGETKFIDTLKYYQKSRAEKLAVKKVPEQFIRSHDYFSEVWKYLGPLQKEKILDIIADGKGTIPYEKIVDANSFSLAPEDGVIF